MTLTTELEASLKRVAELAQPMPWDTDGKAPYASRKEFSDYITPGKSFSGVGRLPAPSTRQMTQCGHGTKNPSAQAVRVQVPSRAPAGTARNSGVFVS